MKADRNIEICQLYRAGWTQDRLSKKFEITRIRVGQILSASGLSKVDRVKTHRHGRTAFVGIFLRPEIKAGLKIEAKNDNKSVSLFISDLIKSELLKRGMQFTVITLVTEQDVPLPLED